MTTIDLSNGCEKHRIYLREFGQKNRFDFGASISAYVDLFDFEYVFIFATIHFNCSFIFHIIFNHRLSIRHVCNVTYVVYIKGRTKKIADLFWL